MLDIRFRIFRGEEEYRKDIVGPHPAGITFRFDTKDDGYPEIQIRPNPDATIWVHDEQRFEVLYNSHLKWSLWEAAGFKKVLG